MENKYCEYCDGDEAVFWEDNENNAFVDCYGEMLVTARDRSVHFKVRYCPMCGKLLDEKKIIK